MRVYIYIYLGACKAAGLYIHPALRTYHRGERFLQHEMMNFMTIITAALRVPLAVTWLTVYRQLHIKLGE